MASPPRLPPKKDVAQALLEQSTVYVHLDPRDEEVRVPDWFKRQPQLVLQIGLNMPVPIPDLRVEDEGISCTLSFNRSPHFCWIPWNAVFALVGDNGRGMVWPEDVPKEVAAQAAQQQKTPDRPKLRAVAEAPERAPTAEAPPAAKKKRARKTKKVVEPKAKTKAVAAAKAAPEPMPAPARKKSESNAAAAPPPAARAGDKRRRALPPYLRVIK